MKRPPTTTELNEPKRVVGEDKNDESIDYHDVDEHADRINARKLAYCFKIILVNWSK